ncbi:MAG: T9SS type A sorting domain-containing protein [Saprospiraceae bacterium]|nr:T9SS type A sorting domain-containing protein [Saprospiraceae bacterium]
MIESTEMIQEVVVLNALGQIMVSLKDPGQSVKLETVHWINGFYFLMISDNHHKRQMVKLVKA